MGDRSSLLSAVRAFNFAAHDREKPGASPTARRHNGIEIYIACIQCPPNHLAIFPVPRYRPAELWKIFKYACRIGDRLDGDQSQIRIFSLKEFFKSIKIGECGS
jgi:hypothetical protein